MSEKCVYVRFVVVVDRESVDSRMGHQGGDYAAGRTIAIQDGQPVAVRFWSSADYAYCPHEGRYGECSEDCEGVVARPEDFAGLESGEPLDPELVTLAKARLETGQFARMAGVPPFPDGSLSRRSGKYS